MATQGKGGSAGHPEDGVWKAELEIPNISTLGGV